MPTDENIAIACTLTSADYRTRLAWIAELNRDALRRQTRRDLDLELVYAPEARPRVHEMVRRERECCGFLAFELTERADGIHLSIRAPERAREAADELLAPFTR